MPQSSDYYQQQLEAMGDMPDFQSTIAKAYEKPIIRPLVQEGAALQEQYLPTVFDTFVQTGTGAGDMSAAAKLATIGRNLSRLTGQTQMNRDIQDFYRTQISDLANLEYAKWTDKQQRLKDLYSMAYQREAAARQAAAQRAQMDAINAAIEDAKRRNAEAEATAKDAAYQQLMGSTAEQLGYDTSTLAGFNEYRQAKGLPVFTEDQYANYFPNYAKGTSANPGELLGAYMKASDYYQQPDWASKYIKAPTYQGLGMLGEAFMTYNPLAVSGFNINDPLNPNPSTIPIFNWWR